MSVPGGPSLFLARYPPNLAIHVTASAMDGGTVGRSLFFVTLMDRTVHSCSERKVEQGMDGLVRTMRVTVKIRHATMLMSTR